MARTLIQMSFSAFVAFVAAKPADEEYQAWDTMCALGQFFRATYPEVDDGRRLSIGWSHVGLDDVTYVFDVQGMYGPDLHDTDFEKAVYHALRSPHDGSSNGRVTFGKALAALQAIEVPPHVN